MSEESIIKLKSEGDVAFASGNYPHALNCYSLGLKELVQRFEIDAKSGIRSFLSPDVFELELSLLNKRSVVYVKTQNYKYALDDARAIVNIRPMWFKGEHVLSLSPIYISSNQTLHNLLSLLLTQVTYD